MRRVVVLLLVVAFLTTCGRQGAPTATSQPRPPCTNPGDTWTRLSDGMVMLCVRAGDFLMGSTGADPDAEDDEKPAHTVYLDAFWIDRTEVTNAQYRKCVNARACSEPGSDNCPWHWKDLGGKDHPVVCVSWDDAQAYCAWAGARLPTEAEWEKAARGPAGQAYPWGNTFDRSLVNYCDSNCSLDHKDRAANDGYARTAPVGSYPAGASPYGALDMSGNVWEWVSDWWDAGYYGSSPASNPQGPDSGAGRVLRGGCWNEYSGAMRSAIRDHWYPGMHSLCFGFRCSLSSTTSP